MTARERVNILLVDDQAARLLSYEAILAPLEQNLVRASSGVEALQKLLKEEYAVILLDVSMPEMDGFETAALIHQHPRFERTPIIFVTGHNVTDMDALRGYELGAVDYVYVPIVPEILRGKVSVLVELHLKRQELQRANRSLEQANAQLALANTTLQAEKTRELEQLNAVLERANAGLAEANRTLNAEVAERQRAEEALRRSHERLREADRQKDEFLAMLAHELRNPLAPIHSAVELMALKEIADPEVRWCRDVIERQTEQLHRLVDDLLDVSRITQGKIKLQSAPLEVSAVISRALETTRPLIERRRHQLSVSVPEAPIWIEGDRTRLTQVVGNLLNNAAKYTPEGGQIRLTVELAGAGAEAQVLIRVSDSGTGISNEMLPKVFELFTQVDRTVHQAQGGLGIGLALVRRLVELHGGSVAAHSDGPGSGSEFVVRLPLLRQETVAPASPTAGDAAAPGLTARRVLVVDDNVDAALSLAGLLKVSGNIVETAYDGQQGIDAADRFRPEVVFLDLGMPKIDGFGAASWIRSQPWAEDVLLVAVTGWGQEDVRTRTQESGFDAHLVKPVNFAKLSRVLAQGRGAGRNRVG
ncbi:response regulator [Nannocystis sp. SCPEA4]|uniref:response regulator n=1 Tax=Nannocystis sp. SCPEA4 TaxID=2996787 RepID=UPI00227021F0|nr:response regulator [Nannocystis sp. SCPEA4]MCY1060263.1 response regulator [Nannocystis sp. SCPEA4]